MNTQNTNNYPDRNEAIKLIKAALKRRSGHAWSVRGGQGTAWGWITIDVMPKRLVNGSMSDADHAELKELLGLEGLSRQGESIPASGKFRQEYVDRAEGKKPSVIGEIYWD